MIHSYKNKVWEEGKTISQHLLEYLNADINYMNTLTSFVFSPIKQANLISESLVVFVCATTGQGDPPDNMKVKLSWKKLLYVLVLDDLSVYSNKINI